MPCSLPAGLSPGGRFSEWERRVPRYVVADVDGTLIAEGTTATPEVADAVLAATQAGLRVGVATGRLPAGLSDLSKQLRFSGPHVVHNGAQVRDRGSAVHTWPIHPRVAVALADWCLAAGVYAEFFVADGFVVTDRRAEAHGSWKLISGEPTGLVSDIDWGDHELIKASVVAFQTEDVSQLLAGLRGLGLVAESSTSPLFPGDQFINITGPEADKGRAVAWAAEYLGIELAEVVAIGDGMNDLSMLAVAGTAIAMGQAPAQVQEVAHLIVPEVADNGVAHALSAAVGWLAE